MEDYSLYAEEEELYENEEGEAVEEEGSNRTFMILVGSLGGLLVVAICIFALWAFVWRDNMADDITAQNHDIEATNEVVALTATAGALAEAALLTDTVTDTPVPEKPTDAPEPTRTSAPAATPVPEATTPPGEGTEEATPAEATEAATPAAVAVADTATPRPAATARATTPTPKPGKAGVPETGLGAVGVSVLAMGLLFMLIVVRRLRHAA